MVVRGDPEPPPGVRLGRPGARRQAGLLRRGRQRRRRQPRQGEGFPTASDGERFSVKLQFNLFVTFFGYGHISIPNVLGHTHEATISVHCQATVG